MVAKLKSSRKLSFPGGLITINFESLILIQHNSGYYGLTENARREIADLLDNKLSDEVSGHENAKREGEKNAY